MRPHRTSTAAVLRASRISTCPTTAGGAPTLEDERAVVMGRMTWCWEPGTTLWKQADQSESISLPPTLASIIHLKFLNQLLLKGRTLHPNKVINSGLGRGTLKLVVVWSCHPGSDSIQALLIRDGRSRRRGLGIKSELGEFNWSMEGLDFPPERPMISHNSMRSRN
ncbi:hypothetical protein BDN72DRAFT_622590 [Pluteus cervinus]|uniref:Uncharacterized protein n=1 Tax=Pluteus cervinus TaxID=181527 RepID=A0ACD3AUJ6_9AGAR|nr:hypothetical protein BDN72DRAFT_622590 [Pluteus cervinus]